MSLMRRFFRFSPGVDICTGFPLNATFRIADEPLLASPGETYFRVHYLWVKFRVLA